MTKHTAAEVYAVINNLDEFNDDSPVIKMLTEYKNIMEAQQYSVGVIDANGDIYPESPPSGTHIYVIDAVIKEEGK